MVHMMVHMIVDFHDMRLRSQFRVLSEFFRIHLIMLVRLPDGEGMEGREGSEIGLARFLNQGI